ncbi:hypothetical protein OLU46_00625 [Campylobacter jejuni]|nr:hypothetical protein [Campylobacter jejuni]
MILSYIRIIIVIIKNIRILIKKNYYVEIAWYQSMQPKYKHISKILNKNKPVVILTRDPISRLKTMVNHGSYKIEELGKNELKKFLYK